MTDSKTMEDHIGECRVFWDEEPTLLGPDSAAVAILAEARKYDFGLIFKSQIYPQSDCLDEDK